MNLFEKLRYLGPAQTARKCSLKVEKAAKALCLGSPPAVPPAEQIDLRLSLLAYEFDSSAPNRWHRSPDTGKSWPLVYSQAISLDGAQAAGDVKLTWELNRHQFLPALAGKDPELARKILRDWVAQNPFEFGVNWRSAMEVGLRLIAWLETFEKAPQLRAEFAGSLAQHARFIRHNISSDWIPRGNHLIGEAAALALYGRQYAAFARRQLARAAHEQFYPSGVHREQSVAYHKFVTHLFSIAGSFQPKALAYLAAIRQPDGSLPNVGDSDDGFASTRPLDIAPAPKTSVAFSDAGHYVLRHGDDYCFIRCGEFGLPPNYSHGHADLLSPVLWLRGEPIFVDAGTFTYNGDPQWRRHFRSAHAHNVVTVDDRDYAEQTGTFSWDAPPRGTCDGWSESEFSGSHDAYRSLGTSVRRRIMYADGSFTISDHVEGHGKHQLRWRFHLHPTLKITRCTGEVFEMSGQFALRVRAPKSARLSVGQGWYSPSYNVRLPTQVCEISLDARLPVTGEFTVR